MSHQKPLTKKEVEVINNFKRRIREHHKENGPYTIKQMDHVLLCIATYTRDTKEMLRLISDRRYTRDFLQTAYKISVDKYDLNMAKLLCDHGANPNWKGYLGRTALYLATLEQDLTMCKYFLDKGAEVDSRNRRLGSRLSEEETIDEIPIN